MRERSSRPGRLYAAVPNDAMRDKRLSIEARGLLALLMTYSDEWVFIKEHLQEIAGIGRDKFERVMGELISEGYVERVLTREAETGKLLGSTWVIRDDRGPEIQGFGSTEALKNRPPAEPTPGKSAPKNNNREEKQKGRTPLTPQGESEKEPSLFSEDPTPPKKPNVSELFERFWKEYPKKVGKPSAKKNFCRALSSGADAEAIIAGARRYAKSDAVQRGFVKHPQGWLTDERWNDGPPQEELTAAQIRLRAILGKEAAE